MAEPISVFDMLKIGVGPSSSHTLGPWRATQRFVRELADGGLLPRVRAIQAHLYGSLALTGKGHATDRAISLALLGHEPETVPVERVEGILAALASDQTIALNHPTGRTTIPFDPSADILFHTDRRLPFHPNGLRFSAMLADGEGTKESTYYSVGGGFVVKEGEADSLNARATPPHPVRTAADLQSYCDASSTTIADVVRENERAWKSDDQIDAGVLRIWHTMRECAFRGCITEGTLPGGLNVTRRAPKIYRNVVGAAFPATSDGAAWAAKLTERGAKTFQDVARLVSGFAIGVNEENAAMGRVVTAPTNGAAGVLPAVLLYYVCLSGHEPNDRQIVNFLLVASQIGALFKQGATISAAMGGCQAEIGVSSAMAAAALAECMGSSPAQALMAAEIAMEHHLGMTCDPVGGLVQIPCIERNAFGAVKAINAAELALIGDPATARVSLDDVIRTMWQTAQDMAEKYKETSQGGLAVNVSVSVPEC